jgi:methionyl-tRNA synthetase
VKDSIMPEQKNSFYVTTPIYYVTAKPHLGSLYSTIMADVLARFYAQRKYDVFFLTGTDEHGQKIAEAAANAKQDPKPFVDSFIPTYQHIWKLYGINYTYFMRTTAEFHKKAVQELILSLVKKGDIYKSKYEGWYCTPCETFVGQKQENDTTLSCPSCSRETKIISEESYFFKLSAYQDKLLSFYQEHPDFITPKERFAEVMQFVRDGLKDVSISRTSVSWGVPFPSDSKHTIYVWIEALCNYITAIGYGQVEKQEEFQTFWPADFHVIGKDIVRFHAVYWPALLFVAGLSAPRRLLVHGWITVEKQKMSKSLGNVVDPEVLAQKYHVDVIRYYLLRYLPITQDGDFSFAELATHSNADLANDLGNLLQRIVVLYKKGNFSYLRPFFESSLHESIKKELLVTLSVFESELQNGMFHNALAAVWKIVQNLNAFFHANEPWKHLKDNKEFTEEILWISCYGLYCVALLLHPVMPEKMDALLFSLGIIEGWREKHIHEIIKGNWQHQFVLTQIPVLFEKYETKKETKEDTQKKIQENKVAQNIISFDDFAKTELRVGTIVSVNEVPKSNKLLLLSVDFGDLDTRQIVSGIKEYFSEHDLLNKQALFVYNLESRKIFGHESQGMILLATDESGTKSLMVPEKKVKSGTMLK